MSSLCKLLVFFVFCFLPVYKLLISFTFLFSFFSLSIFPSDPCLFSSSLSFPLSPHLPLLSPSFLNPFPFLPQPPQTLPPPPYLPIHSPFPFSLSSLPIYLNSFLPLYLNFLPKHSLKPPSLLYLPSSSLWLTRLGINSFFSPSPTSIFVSVP